MKIGQIHLILCIILCTVTANSLYANKKEEEYKLLDKLAINAHTMQITKRYQKNYVVN